MSALMDFEPDNQTSNEFAEYAEDLDAQEEANEAMEAAVASKAKADDAAAIKKAAVLESDDDDDSEYDVVETEAADSSIPDVLNQGMKLDTVYAKKTEQGKWLPVDLKHVHYMPSSGNSTQWLGHVLHDVGVVDSKATSLKDYMVVVTGKRVPMATLDKPGTRTRWLSNSYKAAKAAKDPNTMNRFLWVVCHPQTGHTAYVIVENGSKSHTKGYIWRITKDHIRKFFPVSSRIIFEELYTKDPMFIFKLRYTMKTDAGMSFSQGQPFDVYPLSLLLVKEKRVRTNAAKAAKAAAAAAALVSVAGRKRQVFPEAKDSPPKKAKPAEATALLAAVKTGHAAAKAVRATAKPAKKKKNDDVEYDPHMERLADSDTDSEHSADEGDYEETGKGADDTDLTVGEVAAKKKVRGRRHRRKPEQYIPEDFSDPNDSSDDDGAELIATLDVMPGLSEIVDEVIDTDLTADTDVMVTGSKAYARKVRALNQLLLVALPTKGGVKRFGAGLVSKKPLAVPSKAVPTPVTAIAVAATANGRVKGKAPAAAIFIRIFEQALKDKTADPTASKVNWSGIKSYAIAKGFDKAKAGARNKIDKSRMHPAEYDKYVALASLNLLRHLHNDGKLKEWAMHKYDLVEKPEEVVEADPLMMDL